MNRKDYLLKKSDLKSSKYKPKICKNNFAENELFKSSVLRYISENIHIFEPNHKSIKVKIDITS